MFVNTVVFGEYPVQQGFAIHGNLFLFGLFLAINICFLARRLIQIRRGAPTG
jgi:hypothetical protein